MFRIIKDGAILRAKISKKEFENRVKYNRLQSADGARLAKEVLLSDLPIDLSKVEIYRTSRSCFTAKLPNSIYLAIVPDFEQEQSLIEQNVLIGPYGADPSVASICGVGGYSA